ncbi:TadE/TadG family type IV pilus assembly protein [Jannaschia sp. R86511]|uniref:TadE/TadG family type IV pilus assembly protein n=1 Tax=Jannaschia sp. R86511 TaxID=3093853 RepID=UPI0036D25AF7
MRRRAARPDSGAAAVEFALVSVVLFTLLFGIVQYGFYFFQATSVASLTGQVGRAAAVRVDCDDWRQQVSLQVSGTRTGAAVVSASVGPTDDDRVDGPRRGDTETVSVTWEPTEVGVVAFPAMDFEERLVVRHERLGQRPEASCAWTRPAT